MLKFTGVARIFRAWVSSGTEYVVYLVYLVVCNHINTKKIRKVFFQ